MKKSIMIHKRQREIKRKVGFVALVKRSRKKKRRKKIKMKRNLTSFIFFLGINLNGI
jgi:hypothetical protein